MQLDWKPWRQDHIEYESECSWETDLEPLNLTASLSYKKSKGHGLSVKEAGNQQTDEGGPAGRVNERSESLSRMVQRKRPEGAV